MMRTALILSAFTLAACNDPTPPDVPAPAVPPTTEAPAPASQTDTDSGPIPADFRHVWAIDPADCAAEPGLTRIAIAPGAIRFYEGRAVVAESKVRANNVVILDVDHMAEGATERERHTLSLMDAGQSRLMYQRRGESFTYIRCG